MKNTERKILVIEDDEIIRDNLLNLFELEGYKIKGAENGKEGIDKAFILKPDLIICDVMMPDINGFEVLEILSRENDFKRIPFLFLTALTETSNFRKGMNLGADDYIFKPFDSERLLLVVKNRLDKFEFIKSINKESKSKINPSEELEKALVKIGNKSYPLDFNSIIYLMADRQYSNIYTSNKKKYVIKKSLKEWESLLPGNIFIRIHRSFIINIDYVNKIEKNSSNHYSVNLNMSNNVIEVSRRFYKNLKKLSI
jgi:DNA-binding LytR/AlgR family response regulator